METKSNMIHYNFDKPKDLGLVSSGDLWESQQGAKGFGQNQNPLRPFIAQNNNGMWNFPNQLKPSHAVEHILDIVQNKETIEIIYRVTKDPQSDILPDDKIIKKVFGIEDGQMVFLGERDGKYVKPQPASYTFDE